MAKSGQNQKQKNTSSPLANSLISPILDGQVEFAGFVSFPLQMTQIKLCPVLPSLPTPTLDQNYSGGVPTFMLRLSSLVLPLYHTPPEILPLNDFPDVFSSLVFLLCLWSHLLSHTQTPLLLLGAHRYLCLDFPSHLRLSMVNSPTTMASTTTSMSVTPNQTEASCKVYSRGPRVGAATYEWVHLGKFYLT